MLFLVAVIIFFIGMMGEYVLTINQRVMRRPLVVEEERLNFDVPGKDKGADAGSHGESAKGADAGLREESAPAAPCGGGRE